MVRNCSRISPIQTFFHDSRNAPHHIQTLGGQCQYPLSSLCRCGSRGGYNPRRGTPVSMPTGLDLTSRHKSRRGERRRWPRRSRGNTFRPSPTLSMMLVPRTPASPLPVANKNSTNTCPTTCTLGNTFALRCTSPTLWQMQDETPDSVTCGFWEGSARIFRYDVNYLSNGLNDITSDICQGPYVLGGY